MGCGKATVARALCEDIDEVRKSERERKQRESDFKREADEGYKYWKERGVI